MSSRLQSMLMVQCGLLYRQKPGTRLPRGGAHTTQASLKKEKVSQQAHFLFLNTRTGRKQRSPEKLNQNASAYCLHQRFQACKTLKYHADMQVPSPFQATPSMFTEKSSHTRTHELVNSRPSGARTQPCHCSNEADWAVAGNHWQIYLLLRHGHLKELY